MRIAKRLGKNFNPFNPKPTKLTGPTWFPVGKILSFGSKPEFQLTSQTPKFGQADVFLSTVSLPIVHPGGSYESCVFYKDGQSEVLERYWTRAEAQKGHVRHAIELGLMEGLIVSKEPDPIVRKRRIKFDEEV